MSREAAASGFDAELRKTLLSSRDNLVTAQAELASLETELAWRYLRQAAAVLVREAGF